ncbi:spermidine synthase [Oribacterium sp. WCC10]|uniref:spermidine synthase n=1 Tax=Oribacterium sp. WCC10 TaxID=1855343 RepID=UPI0008E97D4B|nr:hypothetical protein [Oribacterium sp. WCC10]SFG29671.1 Spermine/spermidine synthase [Oribacterium sp. WCC10]
MENFNIDEYIEERKTLYTREDPLTGHIEVCEGFYDGEHMRFLLVDDAMQSAQFTDPEMEFELPFDYMESFNWIFSLNKNIKRTLLIGGGGFAYPKYYLGMYPDKYMDAIEISEPVIDTARRYFGLGELEKKAGEHLQIIVGDGNKFLIDRALSIREAGNALDLRYDVILNDAYVGHESSSLLKKSAELVKACLNENGIYAANMVIPLRGPRYAKAKEDMDVFSEVFNYTFLLQCDEEINPYVPQNCIFFASDAPFEM